MSASTEAYSLAKASSPETLASRCFSTSYLSYFLQMESTRVRMSMTLILLPFGNQIPISVSMKTMAEFDLLDSVGAELRKDFKGES